MPATRATQENCIDLHKTVVHSGLHALHSTISYNRLQWIPLHQSSAEWRILWSARHKFSLQFLHCEHLIVMYIVHAFHYITLKVPEVGGPQFPPKVCRYVDF